MNYAGCMIGDLVIRFRLRRAAGHPIQGDLPRA
jgi:hypothetical protein